MARRSSAGRSVNLWNVGPEIGFSTADFGWLRGFLDESWSDAVKRLGNLGAFGVRTGLQSTRAEGCFERFLCAFDGFVRIQGFFLLRAVDVVFGRGAKVAGRFRGCLTVVGAGSETFLGGILFRGLLGESWRDASMRLANLGIFGVETGLQSTMAEGGCVVEDVCRRFAMEGCVTPDAFLLPPAEDHIVREG